MTADLAPGVIVEMYRGTEEAPFVHGARFTVKAVWDDPARCRECLPGYAAPAMLLAEVDPPAGCCFCSCVFRPVREGGEPQSIAREVQARERAPAGV